MGHPCRGLVAALAAFAAVLAGFAPVARAEEPLLVTFGKDAFPREGDSRYKQVIYLSVPDTEKSRLFVRLYDPGIGPGHDELKAKTAETRTRFAVFGGPGAFVGQSAKPRTISEDELTAGKLITERTWTADGDGLGTWVTLAALDPSQGDHVGSRLVFRLVVEGLSGDAGNVYDVFLSTRDRRNKAPDGLEMFSYTTTVRVSTKDELSEMRFRTPLETTRYTVQNFDAANASLFLNTAFDSFPLKASGQGDWVADEVTIPAGSSTGDASVSFQGGDEMPNDATFSVTNAEGVPVPIALPSRSWPKLRRPKAETDVSYLASCRSVAFDASRSSDPKGGRLSYKWSFGDGATATGPAIRHDYAAPGRYKARLEVLGSSGQIGDGAARDFDVFIKVPPSAKAAAPKVIGVGEPATFEGGASAAGDLPIKSYAWSFNDGKEMKGASVTRTFDRPGRYLATLTVDDGSGQLCPSSVDQVAIVVNGAPVAAPGEPKRSAPGEAVAFDGSRSFDPDGKLTAFHWDFGDGATSNEVAPSHVYEKPGTYTVSLSVTDDSGVANSTTTAQTTVIVNARPVAVAGKSLSAAIGEPITFNGSASSDSDGRLTSWAWDFGDGGKGSGVKTVYAYAKSGVYTVKLTVTDDSGSSNGSASDTLTVTVNEPPIAVAGPHQRLTDSLFHFDGSKSSDKDGEIAKYEWDFGDGTSGTGPKPDHVYEKPGVYRVRLTVTDNSGTIRSSASDDTEVIVNARPVADAGSARTVAPGETVVFDASRSIDPDGDIVSYAWDFRDGATATGRVVRHAYEKPGTYDARLTIQDDTRQPEAVDHAEVRITVNERPVAKAGPPLLAAPGDAVKLSSAGSFDPDGKIATWRWDFSDGEPAATTPDAVRRYAKPGTYTAHLTVTDNSGASNGTATDEVTISINHQPVADAGPAIVTDSTLVDFDGTRSSDGDGDPLTYRWDFGDGQTATGAKVQHVYATGGVYPVVLVVDDGRGLGNSTSKTSVLVTIHKAPVADAGQNRAVCTGDVVPFDGSKSKDLQGGSLRYSWDFGDGTTAEIVNPTKTYVKPGTYPVTLKVQDSANLPNSTHTSRVIVDVDQGPVAKPGPNIEACARTHIQFDGSASFDPHGAIRRFAWDFGDGGIALGDKPTHMYEKPGKYRVFLKIDGESIGRCDPTATGEMMVDIIQGPVPSISAPRVWPVKVDATFDGSASSMPGGSIADWSWDFGDGTTGSGPVAKHAYEKAGVYTATLTVRKAGEQEKCQEVSATHVIRVNAPPQPVIDMPDSVAQGATIIIDGSKSSDPDGGIGRYAWDFGDGEKAEGVVVRHIFRQPGTYKVTLTTTDDAGVDNSIVTAEKTVTVRAAPAPQLELPETACVGDDVSLGIEGAPVTRARFGFGEWRKAPGPGEPQAFTQRVDKPGLYDVTVMLDDGKGLPNSVIPRTRQVKVNDPPVSAPGTPQMACPAAPVSFDASASRDPDGKIIRYAWDFGDGESGEGAKIKHTYAKPGTYTVSLTVTDDSGSHCASTTALSTVVVNSTPVPEIGGERDVFTGGANDGVLLDASGSKHPDGRPMTFSWKIGDGTTESGEKVRHVFRKGGDIPVTLTAKDDTGLTCGAASATVTYKVQTRRSTSAKLP